MNTNQNYKSYRRCKKNWSHYKWFKATHEWKSERIKNETTDDSKTDFNTMKNCEETSEILMCGF